MSYQFNVSFIGETSIIFFRDMGKLQIVVNFDCNFTLLLSAPDDSLLLSDLNVNCELSNQCQFC